MGLVTGLARLGVDAANLVDELDTGHPLVDGELNLASEVVDVTDHGTKNLTVARSGVGAHAINDLLGEVRVESVRGGHLDGLSRYEPELRRRSREDEEYGTDRSKLMVVDVDNEERKKEDSQSRKDPRRRLYTKRQLKQQYPYNWGSLFPSTHTLSPLDLHGILSNCRNMIGSHTSR